MAGSEQLTIVERVVGWTRISYPSGCILIGLILGAPGFYLLFLLDTLDPGKALTMLTSSAFFTVTEYAQPIPLEQGIAVAALFTAFLILTLYYVRYMRVTWLTVESKMARLHRDLPLAGAGDTSDGVTNLRYVLLMVAAFSLGYVPLRVVRATGAFSLFGALVLVPAGFFVVATALWVYFRSLWRMYKLGSGQLQLVPYYEDRMLGLHAAGSMALSFGIVYLTLDVVALAAGILTGDLSNLVVLAGLLVLLATMLVFPVYGMHRKMVVVKNQERKILHAKIMQLTLDAQNERSSSGALSDIKNLIAYRMLNNEAAKIPTWPFETGRLERFLAIFLSVTAIIIARLIQLAFHF